MPFILAILVLVIDQVSKILCASLLPALPGASLSLWDGVFNLTYLENKGAAFGMLSGAPWLLHIITGVLSLALIFILVKRYRAMPKLMRYALCLILAGALGNIIDRVFLGYVRDMLDFCLINFYVFNVADAAITIGAILLALDILFFKGRDFIKNEFEDDNSSSEKLAPAETEEPDTPGNDTSTTESTVQREK